MSDPEEAAQKRPNRVVAIVLGLVAAAALVFAAVTDKWLTNGNDYEQINFGLRSMSQCGHVLGETPCDARSNSEFVQQLRDFGETSALNTSSAFAPMGWITLVAALLAAFGLLGAAAIAVSGKKPDLPMTPATLALLGIIVGIITGCVFIATKPGPTGFVGAGLSFWVFGGGCVLGIAAAQMLAKVNRPLDPDLMHDAMNADEF
jgi:hypothetical protein